MQQHEPLCVRSRGSLVTQLRDARKRTHAKVRRINSYDATSRTDLFSEMLSKLGDHLLVIFGLLMLCLLLLSIACNHVFGETGASASVAEPSAQLVSASTDANKSAQSPGPSNTVQKPGLLQFFGIEQDTLNGAWVDHVSTLAFRLTLAALLGALVAFRPRRSCSVSQRNPQVVQTQILLAVVASALMMIVGDSAARAFGIFAAASLVRFRTNIRDPKETTVLLINLGIGLAAGVGRWELATMFTIFVLVLLQLLESYADHQAFRSMELSVKTQNVETTDEAVRAMFRRNNLVVDIRQLNKGSEKHPLGKVVYLVGVSPRLDTDRLAAEIYSADSANIDRIQWHNTKEPSYA